MNEIEAFVAQVGPRLPDGPLVVALSGGADSAALALAVARRRVPARAVTVDHGLRASATLVEAARQVAVALGLDHRIVVARPASTEGDLREARLAAIESTLASGESVVTGHTRDDQAETVLGNLLRGAGTTGLAGIPRHRGRWRRPLLDVPRSVTRRVATAAGLPFFDDPDNEDPAIRRNRLRHETIPALEAAYNPALREALARGGALLAADDEVLALRARRVPIRVEEGAVLIPAAALATLPGPIATRVVRRALRCIHHPFAGSAADVGGVMAVLDGGRRGLSGGVVVGREGPFVALVTAEAPTAPDAVEFDVPGSVDFGAWRISAGPATVPPLGRRSAIIGGEGPLVVREARPGDRIAIRGGKKKVAAALAEAGVPVRLRPRWPLVERNGHVAWLVGVRAAETAHGDVVVTATRRRP